MLNGAYGYKVLKIVNPMQYRRECLNGRHYNTLMLLGASIVENYFENSPSRKLLMSNGLARIDREYVLEPVVMRNIRLHRISK